MPRKAASRSSAESKYGQFISRNTARGLSAAGPGSTTATTGLPLSSAACVNARMRASKPGHRRHGTARHADIRVRRQRAQCRTGDIVGL